MRAGVSENVMTKWVRFVPRQGEKIKRGKMRGNSDVIGTDVAETARENDSMTAGDIVVDEETNPEMHRDVHDIEGGYADADCSICLQNYEEGDVAIQLPCGHVYHENC